MAPDGMSRGDRATRPGSIFDGLHVRALPANPQAEQGVLGAILTNNKVLPAVAAILQPEHFADPVHGQIYAACLAVADAGSVADAITLRHRFEHTGGLDDVGGTAYLAQLITACVGLPLAEPYARAVLEAWQRRQIIEAAEATANLAFAADMAPAEAVARGMALVDAVLDSGGDARRGLMIEESWDAAVEDMEEAARRDGPAGLSTCMATIDTALGGMSAGEMVVLAARPGMGKSALALQVALSAAQACAAAAKAGGTRSGVLMLSLEMSAQQLGRRAIAVTAGVPVQAMKQGRHGAFANQIVAARRGVAGLPLLIEDTPGQTARQIHLRAKAAARRFGRLALIVVDHLHIVRPEGQDAKNGGTWAVGQISNALKRMAKEFDCPVLALAQLSRGVEGRDDKRPTMADLRYSGEIEQDADAILFLYREEYYLPKGEPARKPGQSQQQYAEACIALTEQRARARGKAELIAAKVRDGEPQTVVLDFDGPTTRFTEPRADDRQGEIPDGRWA